MVTVRDKQVAWFVRQLGSRAQNGYMGGEIGRCSAIALKEYGFPPPVWRGDPTHETDTAHGRTRRSEGEDPYHSRQEEKPCSHSNERVGA